MHSGGNATALERRRRRQTGDVQDFVRHLVACVDDYASCSERHGEQRDDRHTADEQHARDKTDYELHATSPVLGLLPTFNWAPVMLPVEALQVAFVVWLQCARRIPLRSPANGSERQSDRNLALVPADALDPVDGDDDMASRQPIARIA